MLLGLGLGIWGCQKKQPPPKPAVVSIPTPVVFSGNIFFIHSDHLYKFNLNTLTPLTAGKSIEWFPACSPSGSEVAYWSNFKSSVYNLWKIQSNGTNPVQLTNNQINALPSIAQNLLLNDAPAWSPNSKQIVYSLAGNLWLMNSNGYNPETLLLDYDAYSPAFSPSGRSLIFISKHHSNMFNLWKLNISTLNLTQITHHTRFNVGDPSFSSNGKKILFNLFNSTSTNICLIDSNGQNAVTLTKNNTSLSPVFVNDDHFIVYSSSLPNHLTLNLYRMNSNGHHPSLLFNEGNSPSWGPSQSTK